MLNFVKKWSVISVASFIVVLPTLAQAEKIKGDQICDKIKTCALEGIEGQEIPEQMVEILMTQLDSQCATAFKSKAKEVEDAGLAGEANACADSMLSLSCDELLSPNGGSKKTKECKSFEVSAKEAGIDVK